MWQRSEINEIFFLSFALIDLVLLITIRRFFSRAQPILLDFYAWQKFLQILCYFSRALLSSFCVFRRSLKRFWKILEVRRISNFKFEYKMFFACFFLSAVTSILYGLILKIHFRRSLGEWERERGTRSSQILLFLMLLVLFCGCLLPYRSRSRGSILI